MTKQTSPFDMVIIGGGISGIIMLKRAIKAKLRVILLEKQDKIGGLWAHLPEWQDLQTPKEDWALNKIDIKSEYQKDVLQNIKDWVSTYNLSDYIRTSSPVIKTSRLNNQWVVETDGGVYSCQYLVCATGALCTPFTPEIKTENSIIETYHSGSLKNPEIFKDKSVTILGGGASAFDLLDLCFQHKAKEVHWVYRSVKWMFPTASKPKYYQLSLRKLALMQMQGVSLKELNDKVNEILDFKYKKAGMEEVKPEGSFDYGRYALLPARPLMVKNYKTINRYKGEISKIEGNSIHVNDTKFETDLLIYATGYKTDLSYLTLPGFDTITSPEQLSKKVGSYIVSHDYPNLFFLGPTFWEANATTPFYSDVLAKLILSVIKGKTKKKHPSVDQNVNHWDVLKLAANYDKKNYLPVVWRLKYILKAYRYFKNPKKIVNFR